MLISTIAHSIGAPMEIPSQREIRWLVTDSRTLTFPAESLFVALVSQRNNGHQYIPSLYDRGVRAFVVSELPEHVQSMQDAVFLLVPDTLFALQQIAVKHRENFNLPVIGITGSNGKTIVKEWLFQLLNEDKNIVRSPRSYNSQIGVPLSVWQIKPEHDLAIFEAGISMMGEMEKLEPIICPNIGIFTHIGDAHQENFKDYRQKIQEKLLLFKHAELLIYNSDNPLLAQAIREAALKADLLSWGRHAEADLQLLEVVKEAGQSQLSTLWQKVKFTFCIPFTDEASVANAMHCIALLLHLGYDPVTINKKLQRLEPVAMRLELKQGINHCLLINDSYNADLDALNIALDFLIQQAVSKQLSKTLILSDMLHTGLDSQDLYQKIADLMQAKGIHKLIGIGDVFMQYAYLFKDIQADFFPTTEAFLQDTLLMDFSHEAILLKGSRVFEFEKISHKLEAIVHETVLEVNLNALIDNLNYFRSKLQKQTKIISMVKAFGYGSGSIEIAKALQHHRVDYLAVAVADEGAELREAGIQIPIMVMNPELSTFDILFENHLEPEIYSFELLKAFMHAASRLGLTDYPVHIKIDTGMHRLGFEPEDIPQLITLLQEQNSVQPKSVFSHLAGSDAASLDDFTKQQIELFTFCTAQFETAFKHKILKHVLNSAGIERFPEFQFDMVRLGIGHYGISALQAVSLPQVCTLKTIVLQTKVVKAGETIGYNRNGKVLKDKMIAILPIGYADGFDRQLGNGIGKVYVQGRFAPVIGNVSMDLIAVDITGLDIKQGDIVEVFGENITISDLAKTLNTIPYEILTSVSKRVKRVYFFE